MASLVPRLCVPDPEERRGADWDLEHPLPRAAPTRRPAQPCPCGAGYRQISFIHGLAGGGRAHPPGTRSHGGMGTLHATITTHDARVRTGPAGGAGRGDMAQPGSWLWLKKNVLGVNGSGAGCSEAARGPLGEPLSGIGEEPSLRIFV